MAVVAAARINKPLFTSTNHRIEIRLFSDDNLKTPADVSGSTLLLLLTDPGGSTYSYAVTLDVAASGEGHVNLTGTNHTVAGAWTAQLFVDGIPIAEFAGEFKAKKTAT